MQESHDKSEARFNARHGITYEVLCACGPVYVTCNNFKVTDGSDDTKLLKEIFIRLGKAGGCAAALNESVGKLISHYLQEGGDIEVIVKSLSGVSCHSASPTVPSCIAATIEAIKEHTQTKGKGE